MLEDQRFLKPMEIRKEARVPYETVIHWIEVRHPRAGLLPAVDFSERGKRRSYRIKREDWEAFLEKLRGPAQARQNRDVPPPASTASPSTPRQNPDLPTSRRRTAKNHFE